MQKVKGRVLMIKNSGADSMSNYGGSWYVLSFLNANNGRSEVVYGRADVSVTKDCYIEFEGEEVDDVRYGRQWRVKAGTLINSNPVKDKKAAIGYLSSYRLFPSLPFGTPEKIYKAFGLSFAEHVINEPDDFQRMFGLSDDAMDELFCVIRQDFPTIFLENIFPTMKGYKNMARKILHMGHEGETASFQITFDYIKQIAKMFSHNPYGFVGDGLTLAAIDDVAMNDIGISIDNSYRCLALIWKATVDFTNSFHCAYVNMSREDEARYFALNYLSEVHLGVKMPASLTYTCYRTTEGDVGLFNWFYNVIYRCIGSLYGNTANRGATQRALVSLQGVRNGKVEVFNIRDAYDEIRLYPFSVLKDELNIVSALNLYENYTHAYAQILADRRRKVKAWRSVSQNRVWNSFTPEQMFAVVSSVGSMCSFITGGPGRGKSYVVEGIIDFWVNCLGKPAGCFAPTGQAADRLRRRLGNTCSCETIKHFTVVNNIKNYKKSEEVIIGSKSVPAANSTLIVVDETSMVDYDDAASFLDYVRGCTLVFVGDVDQLQPVGIGNFMTQVIGTDMFPISYLTRNFRASAAVVAANGDALAEGKSLSEMKISVGHDDNDMFMYLPAFDNESLVNAAVDSFGQFRQVESDPSCTLLLAPTNRICYSLNVRLQELYNVVKGKASSVPDMHCPYLEKPNKTCVYYDTAGYSITCFPYNERSVASGGNLVHVRVGDRVINTKNHSDIKRFALDSRRTILERSVGVFNGDRGTVMRYYEVSAPIQISFVEILLDNGYTVFIERECLSEWKLGYALTVHRAQGGEADNVIVCMPTSIYDRLFDISRGGKNPMLTRNLLYTAVTRAKRNVVLVGSKEVIDRAVATPAVSYNDDLAQMLKTVHSGNQSLVYSRIS